MLVSLNWLQEFVACDAPAAEIAERLTMAGIEVEDVISIGSQWDNIIVGEILDIQPHPNADRLACATVKGGDQLYAVVCGAPNIAVGQKIPLALPGAVLPGGLAIKQSKIRGVFSEGMICSEVELGVGTDSSGIMILDAQHIAGRALADALGLRDTIFSLGITPNRSDCFSIIGIAREIAAIYNLDIRYPDITLAESAAPIDTYITVDIRDSDLCPRYTARYIEGVAIRPSPLWMRQRLENCGIRAINNIVDITNYVMLEWGQPLHAFDYRRLHGQAIIVRRACGGESFVTLDEIERFPDNDVVMICDRVHPIAIGGIMGGLASGIAPDTSRVLLESAYFPPASIARSGGILKLKTEASERFKKGVDMDAMIPALNRAAHFMAEYAGGCIARGIADTYPKPIASPAPIFLDVDKVCTTLGLSLSAETVQSLLQRLFIRTSISSVGVIEAIPPTFRYDITEPIDLVEEVARIHGYAAIPASCPLAPLASVPVNTFQHTASRVRDILTALGLQEVINYSFYDPAMVQALRLPADDIRHAPVIIRNPLSPSQSAMRTCILPSLLSNLRTNINHKAESIKIFEISTVFYRQGDTTAEQPRETRHVAGLLAGLRYAPAWNHASRAFDFYDIKGVVEDVLAMLRACPARFVSDSREPYLHPRNMLSIYVHDTLLGVLGEIHPDVLENSDISCPAYMFDLDFDLLSHYYGQYPIFSSFSRYPAIYRDMALVVDADVPAGRLNSEIEHCRHPLMQEYLIFDIYQGDTIPAGKKSVAYRFRYQALDRTLTDNEVNTIHDALLAHLARSIGAELR